jgi:hypothetical protein
LGLGWQNRAGSRDNAVEASRWSGILGPTRRRDVFHCDWIVGKQPSDAIMIVRFEEPVGKRRKIEKARDLVLRGID